MSDKPEVSKRRGVPVAEESESDFSPSAETKQVATVSVTAAAVQPATSKKKFDLSGKYRVREGYSIAHGARVDGADTIGHHPRALPGEVVELSHEDAAIIIRNTKDQKDPVTGRPHGPAIETEDAYNSRIEAEMAHNEFLRQLTESNI